MRVRVLADVELSSLRGPMVVNPWAVWCGPCREEMPILQAFHEEYGDRVPVLGIDYADPQATSAMELVQDAGVTYPLLADPQASLSAQDSFPPLQGLPYLALVDADGRAVLESRAELEDLVAEHLGVPL